MFKTRFAKQVVTLPKLSVEENNVDLNPGNVTEEHMVVFGHRKALIRVTHMGKIPDGDVGRAPPLPTDTRAYARAHAHTHTHTYTLTVPRAPGRTALSGMRGLHGRRRPLLHSKRDA